MQSNALEIPEMFSLDESEDMRARIDRLESVMFKMKEHQVHIEPRHYFAHGLYAREITIPKGTTLIGKIHLFSHINVISKGEIYVMTENGIELIKAPATIISPPGTKRVGFAREETVWTTFHACTETEISRVEDSLVVSTFKELTDRRREMEVLPCHS